MGLVEALRKFDQVGREMERTTATDRSKSADGSAVVGNGKNTGMVNLKHPATKDMMLIREGVGGQQIGNVVFNRSRYDFKSEAPIKTRTTDASTTGHSEVKPSFIPRYKMSGDKTTESLDTSLAKVKKS